MQRNIRHTEFIIGFSKVSLCLNIHIMAASLIKDLKDHRARRTQSLLCSAPPHPHTACLSVCLSIYPNFGAKNFARFGRGIFRSGK